MLDQMELQSAVYRPRSAVQQQSGPVVFGKRERVKKEKAVQKVSRQTEQKKSEDISAGNQRIRK